MWYTSAQSDIVRIWCCRNLILYLCQLRDMRHSRQCGIGTNPISRQVPSTWFVYGGMNPKLSERHCHNSYQLRDAHCICIYFYQSQLRDIWMEYHLLQYTPCKYHLRGMDSVAMSTSRKMGIPTNVSATRYTYARKRPYLISLCVSATWYILLG